MWLVDLAIPFSLHYLVLVANVHDHGLLGTMWLEGHCGVVAHEGGEEAHVGLIVGQNCRTYFSNDLLFLLLLSFNNLCDDAI